MISTAHDFRALIDGETASFVPANDRGLAYGDGLFETVRFVAGRAPLWSGHMARLARGARRLGLAMPAPAHWWTDAERLMKAEDGLVKLLLTRASGRGYAYARTAGCRRIVLALPLPDITAAVYERGLRLRWCRLRLAAQPMLAGLKHLNRLEQVLARAEWRDPRIDEGLLLDADAHVVGATAANLFVVRDGELWTPRLDRCGVAGVARAWLLARARHWRIPVVEASLSMEDVLAADEVFLSNAVRGVMPVRAIDRRRWLPGPITQRLIGAFAQIGIGPAPSSSR